MLDLGIQESITKIDEIIEKEYPLILATLAREIFESKGQSHGRHWEPNTESTKKRKGSDYPNIETGQLEDYLTTPGFLEDDNYMANLPTPQRTGKAKGGMNHQKNYSNTNNYEYANALRPFDDIGKTADDEEFIERQLEIAITAQYKG